MPACFAPFNAIDQWSMIDGDVQNPSLELQVQVIERNHVVAQVFGDNLHVKATSLSCQNILADWNGDFII